jgi:SNF2 family DNA or RNA helicase
MLRLATWAPGCILADDMGLGKTVQTAAVLKARAALGPQLIIAPASVSSNWMSELQRFVPSLRSRWYNDERQLAVAELGPSDVVVVSYGLLQRRSAVFETAHFATVVVDEAQYVKNVSAQRTDAVRSLTRDFTITLTGTPLENHLGELFSIVDLAFPGLLGSEPVFRERFRKAIEGSPRDEVRMAVLGRLLEPFLLRRTRKKVLEELPSREEITEYIELDPEEQKRYLALRRACEQQFAKRKKSETAAQLKIALFAALTRLRQLACDVRLVDPTYEGRSSKIKRVVELCAELAQEGNRALVFSQFTQFLGKLRPELEAAGLRVAYLAGETPTGRRRAIVEAFQRGEYDVFCVSLLAGGTGLNLTSASYVIHTDPWWNPAAEEQATSRAHRMGQTEPVTVYRLVARGTIEEAVLAMHAAKRELADAVLEGKASTRAISSTELLELLRFGE